MPQATQILAIPLRMVFLMWMLFFIGVFFQLNLSVFGIFPRTYFGLVGIITMPLIHGSLMHLFSNTLPLLFLGFTLFFFFNRIALRVFLQCYVLTGISIWVFGRPSIHIGASGVIYALASFLVFFGLFRKDLRSLFISIVIIFLYGGMIYGILPNQPGVSWESHLLGGIMGAILASIHSSGRTPTY